MRIRLRDTKIKSNFKEQTALARSVWDSSGERISELSHIQGFGRWNAAKDFVEWGAKFRAIFDTHFDVEARESKPHNILEWGPGGGAITRSFIDLSGSYWAVDISSNSLRHLRERFKGSEHDLNLVELTGDPADLNLPRAYFDAFVSTAVFQHFPSREYATRVLATVYQSMREGGRGLIQIRYDNGNKKYAPKKLTSYSKFFVTQTSFPIEEFWTLLEETGFGDISCVDLIQEVNYATFVFRK